MAATQEDKNKQPASKDETSKDDSAKIATSIDERTNEGMTEAPATQSPDEADVEAPASSVVSQNGTITDVPSASAPKTEDAKPS